MAREEVPLENEPTEALQPVSYVAAQYFSSKVENLDDYADGDFTTHDYILRIQHENGTEMKLMKQTIQMLLEIFGGNAFNTLSIKDENGNLLWSMGEILKKKLDVLLVPRHEFGNWYSKIVGRIQKLKERLQLYRQMLRSMKPFNYVGRIVMSSTDDTEQKVIKNHGGKKWRRIVNFLRGVSEWSELGTRLGEEYVCLRESNIPVHTHAMSTTEETQPVWQMKKDMGSNDTKTVDVGKSNGGVKLQNRTLDYQISPLEYEQKTIILPHDNMPPYREVYMWECLDPTDEEIGMYVITWDSNSSLTSPEPYYRRYNELIGDIPNISREGYSFVGWFDDDGNRANESIKVTKSVVYRAKWDGAEYTITFNHNDGNTEEQDTKETRTRHYGDAIGTLPEAKTPSGDDWAFATEFIGWFTEKNGGEQITKDTQVVGDATFYAHWNRYAQYFKVGNIVVEDGIASNFSNSNFLRTKQSLNFQNEFEIVMKFTTGERVINPGGGLLELELFSTDNDIEVAISDNLNNGRGVPRMCWEIVVPWDLDQWTTNKPWGTVTMEPNTTYFAKVVKSKTHIQCYVKGENGEWPEIPDKEGYRDTTSNNPIWFGIESAGDYFKNAWNGKIDMKNSYLVVHGKRYNFVEVPSVTVTFDSTGGTPSKTEIQLGSGMKIDGLIPSSPSRENYTFNGWWTSPKAGDAVNSDTVVEEDTTFYAHWIPSQFSISYDLDGGSLPVGMENPSQYNSDTKTFTLINPNKVGYSFHGWSGTGIEGVQTRVVVPRGSSGPRTYLAHWETMQFSIFYNMNGHGVIPSTALRLYTIESDDYSPPPPNPVTGYQFVEWMPSSIPSGSTGNKTFSAEWVVKVLTATFDANGGEGGLTKTQDYGTPLYAPEVSKTGHTLVSWNPEVPLTMPDEDCTFVAQWQPNSYTITFDANGGEGGVVVEQPYGASLDLPEVQHLGCELIGWFTSPTDGVQVDETTIVTGNATYYAHWEFAVYGVVYDTNHIDVEVPETDEYPRTHTVFDEITPPPLEDQQFATFMEWIPPTMPAGTDEKQIFVAQWNIVQVMVTFDANGGTVVGESTRTLDAGSLVGEPPYASRDGYYLVGWYDSLENGNELTEDTCVVEDTTYHAIWMKNTYTVTFRDNIPLTITYDKNY